MADTHMGHGFGRLTAPDVRDARFPMFAEPPTLTPPNAYRFWLPGPVLDQGAKPECVAFAWKQFLQTNPIRQGASENEDAIYNHAQLIDEYPGPPPPYDGTSVRAGAKVLQGKGYISSYLWAQDIEQLKTWVVTTSPVVVGTSWYASMSSPDRLGIARRQGAIVGGHAYCIIGWSGIPRLFRCINSWGVAWGQQGKFWVTEQDMQSLLYNEGGEAVTAIEARK